MWLKKTSYSVLFFFVSLCLKVSPAIADPSFSCGGEVLRPKKEGIPVYGEARQDSEVLSRVALGHRLCAVGVENDFGIVVWTRTGELRDGEKVPNFGFVRLVDVFRGRPASEASIGTPTSLLEKVKRMYYRSVGGGVPEDPLLPYRPFLDLFQSTQIPPNSDANSSVPAAP